MWCNVKSTKISIILAQTTCYKYFSEWHYIRQHPYFVKWFWNVQVLKGTNMWTLTRIFTSMPVNHWRRFSHKYASQTKHRKPVRILWMSQHTNINVWRSNSLDVELLHQHWQSEMWTSSVNLVLPVTMQISFCSLASTVVWKWIKMHGAAAINTYHW